jgi:hypothetical protein
MDFKQILNTENVVLVPKNRKFSSLVKGKAVPITGRGGP